MEIGRLTTVGLQEYLRGQFVIGNSVTGSVFCGEIAAVRLKRGVDLRLIVRLAWSFRGEGFPDPRGWVVNSNLEHDVNLGGFSVDENKKRGRLTLVSPAIETCAAFHSPESPFLEPSIVEGLELPK